MKKVKRKGKKKKQGVRTERRRNVKRFNRFSDSGISFDPEEIQEDDDN